ncbi:MAG: LysM peptidoglycan-binding domain-containing protein [Akkermansiaceae bacterium]
MKFIILTSNLIAALLVTATSAAGENASHLRAMIAMKESELTRVQNELVSLKKQLSSKSPTPASTNTYQAQAGDTLSSIARRHQMSYNQLLKLNKLTDPSKIQIGQEITVRSAFPAPAPHKSTAKAQTPAPSKSKSDRHTVKLGETFYAIARANKISIGKLKELNPGIDTNRIVTGQSLKISGAPAAHIASTRKPSTSAIRPASSPKKTSYQKSPTTAPTRSANSGKPTSRPKSSRKVSEPKKITVKKEVASTTEAHQKNEAPMHSPPQRVSSVILTNETSFADFAKQHGTSTNSLNALNGWNLPKATVLARGSEIYVPK